MSDARPDLDPALLRILACPSDRGPLTPARDAEGAWVLYNPRLRLAYRIDEGIPVLLVDEAREVSEGEHERLTSGGAPE